MRAIPAIAIAASLALAPTATASSPLTIHQAKREIRAYSDATAETEASAGFPVYRIQIRHCRQEHRNVTCRVWDGEPMYEQGNDNPIPTTTYLIRARKVRGDIRLRDLFTGQIVWA